MDCLDSDDDVQFVKIDPVKSKVKPKKSVTWVSSSFGDFGPNLSTPISKTKIKGGSLSDLKRNQTDSNISVPQTSVFAFTSQHESRKRPRESDHCITSRLPSHSKTCSSKDLWCDKYRPLHRNDLAVHKKKVEELCEWLARAKSHWKKHAAPILLLTGPPGSGKTACVQVLCAQLGMDVQEWVTNLEQVADQWSGEDFHRSEKSRVDVYMSQSQSSQFHNFLVRANKYPALELMGSAGHVSESDGGNVRGHSACHSTTVLVEDMPNVFFRDPPQFHNILRKYHYSGHSPIVFIMSDSTSSTSSVQKLFPKDLQHQLGVVSISLNPVAPTLLLKLLNKVMSQEARQAQVTQPNSSVIEQIALSSNGDIRSALNSLQFACRMDTADLKPPVSSAPRGRLKKSGTDSKLKYRTSGKEDVASSGGSVASAIGAKDTSIFLFQAVGKILYLKRGDPSTQADHPCLPRHLELHDRHPLLMNPEEVAAKSHVSGDFFTTFLHENYVEFLSSVEDLERASEYFSDADYMSTLWAAREELQQYSVSVATRGFIHSNSDVVRHDSTRKNHGWRPLHKSRWFATNKQANENITTARQIFQGYHWEPEVLCSEILPYISLTNPTLHDTGNFGKVYSQTKVKLVLSKK
ncbi:cell cycle checkpoint protein RAD17 isoform X2 [Aplysia californica]|uniref:Cell cycle checkpoint protein RAD17 isoform X2 n=1 Tax=Aplysia californica TaxID=6500 RepID=A0ABM1AA11_APLCA|nr:cell cycle checkpoint protein RAD17 isoform X2 [Aplysia californica]